MMVQNDQNDTHLFLFLSPSRNTHSGIFYLLSICLPDLDPPSIFVSPTDSALFLFPSVCLLRMLFVSFCLPVVSFYVTSSSSIVSIVFVLTVVWVFVDDCDLSWFWSRFCLGHCLVFLICNKKIIHRHRLT
jgi:hypothetical protein